MALAFEAIPADVKLPLFYAEVTPAQEPASPNLKMCLIGFMNRASFGQGTAVLNYPYLVTRSDASTLFGRGSMLETMYLRARDQAPYAEIWCIAISEEVDAIQAFGTITVAHPGSATRQGIAAIYIAGRRVQLRVRSTDIANTIATNLAAAINAAQTYLKATVSTNVVTVTCRWAGITGNQIPLTYVGSRGRRSSNVPESALSRYLFTFVQPSGGAGEFNSSSTYGVLDTRNFDVFVIPSVSQPILDASLTFMDGIAGRWSPFKQQYGHIFGGKIGDLSTLTTLGDAQNDPHMSIIGLWKSINPAWEWASALAGVAVQHWAAPPELSRPLQTLPLRNLYVGSDDDDSFNPEERELALSSGITTVNVQDDTTVHIDRVRTLRKTNAYGDPDPSWADAITMFQAQYFVKAMRAAITGAFPRCALTDEPTGINGFTSPAEIKLVIMHEYQRLQGLGLVENYDLFVQFLIVERDDVDRNRVNVLMRPDMVNQLRVVATIVETHLELDPTDPLLQQAA